MSLEKLNSTPLYTAIITPMMEDGGLDLESFKGLLKEQNDAGVGVLILGSTGESLNLSESEKKEILEVTKAAQVDVPVMVGIGGIHLPSTLEWLTLIESYDFDGYLVVTPLYAKPGEEGQYQWFKAILDASKKPCMLYNVPGRTGIAMNHEATARLSDHPNCWAIKEASGSVEEFKKYRQDAPNARIYSGDDGLLPDFTPHGCVGLVSVISNVWPAKVLSYVKQTIAGDLTSESETMWKEVADTLFLASNPIPAKAIMAEKKMIKTPVLKAPLSDKDLADIAPLTRSDERVKNWN